MAAVAAQLAILELVETEDRAVEDHMPLPPQEREPLVRDLREKRRPLAPEAVEAVALARLVELTDLGRVAMEF